MTLHPALQEVIDAYEARRPPEARSYFLKTELDSLCLFYEGKLSDINALNCEEDGDKLLRNAYFIMLKQLRSLQKMVAGKREVLSDSEDDHA